ncbi:hypothetical protein C7S16_2361 [Burkholderia thailandensis]|uniref:Uncharacterized protein n=1 Tax=Burkholderia thailandensis TaxID=57975 RepID=A0AAW9D6Q1_BURTH|nr:hypothetical protein [Burkholderia thailandensis]
MTAVACRARAYAHRWDNERRPHSIERSRESEARGCGEPTREGRGARVVDDRGVPKNAGNAGVRFVFCRLVGRF